jgi:hypothetical protein
MKDTFYLDASISFRQTPPLANACLQGCMFKDVEGLNICSSAEYLINSILKLTDRSLTEKRVISLKPYTHEQH